MAEKKKTQSAAEEPEIVFDPADELEQAAQQAPEAQAPAKSPSGGRYRVLASGISSASGPHYANEELSADEIGDEQRIAKLLAAKAIEAIT